MYLFVAYERPTAFEIWTIACDYRKSSVLGDGIHLFLFLTTSDHFCVWLPNMWNGNTDASPFLKCFDIADGKHYIKAQY